MKNHWKDKKVAVLGWGINGLDIAEYLLKQGVHITIFDDKEVDELDFSEFDTKKVKLVLGSSYIKYGLNSFDYIFRAICLK